MKLALVEHIRCEDYDRATFLLVPDELTEEEFEKAADRAMAAYAKDAFAFKALDTVPNPGHYFNANTYPADWSIAKAKEDWDRKKEAYDGWRKAREAARQKFGSYLIAEIPGAVDIHGCQFHTTLNWGHRHGMGEILNDPDPNTEDRRGVAGREEPSDFEV